MGNPFKILNAICTSGFRIFDLLYKQFFANHNQYSIIVHIALVTLNIFPKEEQRLSKNLLSSLRAMQAILWKETPDEDFNYIYFIENVQTI